MNRLEFVTALSNELGMKQKECEQILEAELDIITRTLQSGDFVRIAGFGRLQSKMMSPRKCHNPRSGEPIMVDAVVKPVFKAGKKLREALNADISKDALEDTLEDDYDET